MNDTPEKTKLSWWRRLSSGLKRTSARSGPAITDLFTKRKLDRDTLEELEDVLMRADLGVEVAARIVDAVGHGRYDKTISADEVKAILAAEVERSSRRWRNRSSIDAAQKPFVDPGGRRQRLRQDDDDRQARRQVLAPRAAR